MKKLCTFLALLALVPSTFAGARRFTFVYEATTAPPGGFELENWVTWQTHRPADHDFHGVDFRHEIEFGITDHLQAGVYVADWDYQSGRSVESSGFHYRSSAIELIYNLTNPATDPLGLAVYEEIRAGDRLVELESKLIAQKNLGPVVLAYNATLEATWEGRDLEERAGEFQQSAGASFQLTPRFLAGAELVHEIEFEDWSRAQKSAIFGGPNVSYRIGNWWTTATALVQLSDKDEEPNFQLRTIFGYTF